MSREYCRRRENAARIHELLEAMLPGEGRKLLQQYDDALADAHGLETEILAERTFIDGMRMVLTAMREE